MDITEEKTGSGGRYVATLEGHEAEMTYSLVRFRRDPQLALDIEEAAAAAEEARVRLRSSRSSGPFFFFSYSSSSSAPRSSLRSLLLPLFSLVRDGYEIEGGGSALWRERDGLRWAEIRGQGAQGEEELSAPVLAKLKSTRTKYPSLFSIRFSDLNSR